jgi:hypothetical protein
MSCLFQALATPDTLNKNMQSVLTNRNATEQDEPSTGISNEGSSNEGSSSKDTADDSHINGTAVQSQTGISTGYGDVGSSRISSNGTCSCCRLWDEEGWMGLLLNLLMPLVLAVVHAVRDDLEDGVEGVPYASWA